MIFKICSRDQQRAVVALFTSTFSTSEGEDEGAVVGRLALDLFSLLDNNDVFCIAAFDNTHIAGAIFFTRLSVDDAPCTFMLSPVAVGPNYQGKGIGQDLIRFGLEELKCRGVVIITTYGDPGFYTKVGFHSLTEELFQAPFALSQPEGWLGLSLTGDKFPNISARPKCVDAFNDPSLW